MDTVRAAVIGVGNIGYFHAKNIFENKVPGMTLAALCDIDEEKLVKAGVELPGVLTYCDYRELLTAHVADAVIIATPHYLHPPIATGALDLRYHVLIEKPAGVYAGAVREMISAAERSGRVFGIMFNQRKNPLFRLAREIVKSGRLGEPKRLCWIITNWYRTQHYYNSSSWRATWRGEGGGVLLNQAPHNLDLLQWIFGMPSALRADCRVGRHHNIEVEDEAAIYCEYDSGASAVFITSTGEFPGTNRLEISGDLGKLVLEEGRLKWWRLRVPEREFCFASDKDFDKIPFDYEEVVPEEKDTGHLGILAEFAGAILNGTELTAPGEEGINQLFISNAAYLSSWQGGRRVALPPDDDEFYAELRKHISRSAQKKIDANTAGRDELCPERWQTNW
ncbi:MAG TPA: Gfo/Idh/MocA family oxidoreductase [Clostridiales bacterium]|jgi:predicted dehydrogenase|nr:Gfo/Idh/MocA family oxidoreductase [Clostridiales bacterium]